MKLFRPASITGTLAARMRRIMSGGPGVAFERNDEIGLALSKHPFASKLTNLRPCLFQSAGYPVTGIRFAFVH
jgi:hypothetical protein